MFPDGRGKDHLFLLFFQAAKLLKKFESESWCKIYTHKLKVKNNVTSRLIVLRRTAIAVAEVLLNVSWQGVVSC